MPHINLLPWREARRKRRQQQFLGVLAAAVGLTVAGVYLGHSYMQGLIDQQQARNERIEQEIALLDAQIREIQDLQETKRQLLARMRIIEELQQRRTEIVHLFDELVATLPDGVYLTALKQEGDALLLDGMAQSNARVSAYMKNLDASPWLRDPQLLVIEATGTDNTKASRFSLRVKQQAPENSDEAKGGGA